MHMQQSFDQFCVHMAQIEKDLVRAAKNNAMQCQSCSTSQSSSYITESSISELGSQTMVNKNNNHD